MTNGELQRRIRILVAIAVVIPLGLVVGALITSNSGQQLTTTAMAALVVVGVGLDGLCVLLILYLKRKIPMATAPARESQPDPDIGGRRNIRFKYRFFVLSAALAPAASGIFTVLLLSALSAPINLDAIIRFLIVMEILIVLVTSSMWIFFRSGLQDQGWRW